MSGDASDAAMESAPAADVGRLDVSEVAAPVDVGPPVEDAGALIGDAPMDVADMTGAPPADGCRMLADCPRGQNCSGGRCVPAPASCLGVKNDNAAAADGVYWISPGGVPQRAYCDMRQRLELCTEVTGERHGVMRDATGLIYRMVSSLDVTLGLCKLWAVRSQADGYPLDRDRRTILALQRDTCQLLGFKSTAAVGECKFGDAAGSSTCGFPVARYFRWGTLCSGCTQNNGEHERFLLQGVIHSGLVMSNWSGSIYTTCRVQ